MSTQPYEIELVPMEAKDDFHLALLATITGLPKAEIYERLPESLKEKRSWRGRNFGEVALLLGYNTKPRFVKFDSTTPWPCIARVQVPDAWGWKGKWWATVYNQGKVYLPDVGGHCDLHVFLESYPGCRITSMLPIWISDNGRD